MMAEKFVIPNMPRLEIVNVPPCNQSQQHYNSRQTLYGLAWMPLTEKQRTFISLTTELRHCKLVSREFI